MDGEEAVLDPAVEVESKTVLDCALDDEVLVINRVLVDQLNED